MAKVVTFGEVMLRLSTPGYLRFSQTRQFDAISELCSQCLAWFKA